MNRNDRSRLSRHEQLRYDYLLKNIHYLSDKERAELDYLTDRMNELSYEEEIAYSESVDTSYQSYDDPYYESEQFVTDPYYDNQESLDYQDNSAYTDQGLPKYPGSESSQKVTKAAQPFLPKRNKKRKSQKAPAKKGSKWKIVKRSLLAIFAILFLVFGVLIFNFIKGMNEVTSGSSDYSPAVQETFNGQDTSDGVNILILGSDQRVTQGSTDARTDTIMVLNVGNKEGKIKLVSFMRDTLINIPGVSYSDYSYDQKLNVAFNLGEQDNGQGAEYMRQALKNNYDIDIKYYMMVDFETFAEAVDTMFPNGVEIDAQFSTVDGEEVTSVEVPDDLNMKDGVVPNQTISVGKQRMDGRTLLNYARFRKDDEGDYGRTKRQQQVLSALISQVKNPASFLNGATALGKIYALTSTNMSFGDITSLGLSNISSLSKGVEQTTIPEYGDWVDEYDMYGGLGLSIDFDTYKQKLSDLGLR